MATAGLASVTAESLVDQLRGNKPVTPGDGTVIEGDVHLEAINYSRKLVLKNCLFLGHVNVADAHFAKTVDLSGCVFEQNVNFAGAQFGGGLRLSGATIHSSEQNPGKARFDLIDVRGYLEMEGLQADAELDFNNARIIGKIKGGSLADRPMICKGGLVLEGANLYAQVDLHGAEIQGNLDLSEVILGGSLHCQRLRVHKDGRGHGGNVLLRAARISGETHLEGSTIDGMLDIQSGEIRCGLFCGMIGDEQTVIAGQAHLPAARIAVFVDFHGARLGALIMPVAVVDGYLNCPRTQIDGDLLLQNAHIKGGILAPGLDLRGSAHLDPVAVGGNIELQQARIAGQATWHGATLEGDLHLEGIHIGGDLWLGNVHFRGDLLASSLKDRRVEVRGQAWLGGARVEGEVRFWGAKIGGDFDLRCAEIREGLSCEGLSRPDGLVPTQISGRLNLHDANISGGVKLQRARLGRGAQLSGATLSGTLHCELLESGGDMDVEGANISGGVHFEDARIAGRALFGSSRFRGDVNFIGTHVDALLDLQDSVVDGDLNCQMLHIQPETWDPECGHALLMGLKVLGEADFIGAKIAGNLNLERAVIDSDVDCSFRHEPLTEIGGTVVLESCRVRHADFDAKRDDESEAAGRTALPPAFTLDCFEFQELTLPDNNYRLFLERSAPFKKSAYHEIERWLHNRGDDAEARRVFHAMRQRQRQEMTRRLRWYQLSFYGRWLQRGLHRLWDLSGALGTQFFFFAYFTIAFAVTLWIFLEPASVILRDHPKEEAPGLVRGQSPPAEEWNWVRAVAMSVQVIVPLVPIRPVEEWEPSHRDIRVGDAESRGLTYRHYVEFVGLVSSLVTAFLGMGITNLIARRRAVRLGAT